MINKDCIFIKSFDGYINPTSLIENPDEDLTTKLNEILSDIAVRGLYIYDDVNIQGTLNVPTGKKIIFRGGKFVGNGVLNLDKISADALEYIFSKDITVYLKSEEINVSWFGANTELLDNQPYIQKAINTAIANNIPMVKIPSGVFNIAKGLLLVSESENGQVSLELCGNAKGQRGTVNETVINCTHNNNFALATHLAKGMVIRNIFFKGVNTLYYSVNAAFDPNSTYKVNDVRDNNYSPYAGIVIDPFHYTVTEHNRYPGFESVYDRYTSSGGSSDVKVIDCSFDGFVVARLLSPSGATFNNDSNEFQGNWILNCRESYSACNTQERNILILNDKIWESVKYCYTTGIYGSGGGDCPNVDGANIAGNIFQIFNYKGFGYLRSSKNYRIHAESFYRLGYSNNEIHFKNCTMSPMHTGTYGLKQQAWIFDFKTVVFDNCMLFVYNDYSYTPLRIRYNGSTNIHSITFRNCITSPIVYQATPDWFLNEGVNKIRYEGINTFYKIPGKLVDTIPNGVFPITTNPTDYLIDLDSKVYYGAGTYLGHPSANVLKRTSVSNLLRFTSFTNALLTVSGITGTIDLSHPDYDSVIDYFKIGMPICINETNNLIDSFGNVINGGHIGRIESIEGRVLTINTLVDGVVTGTYNIFSFYPSYFTEPFIATTIAGAKEAILESGNPVTTYKYQSDGVYWGINITSINGNILTMDAPAKASGTFTFRSFKSFDEFMAEPTFFGLNGVYINNGTLLKTNNDEVPLRVCTKSGHIGGLIEPVFSDIKLN